MSFNLSIVTPEGPFFEGRVEAVNIKIATGYIGILPNHSPLVSTIESCVMTMTVKNKKEILAISGGVLNVTKNGTYILADAIEYQKDIDINRARAAEQRAREVLSMKRDEVEMARAKRALRRSLARINAYERK